MRNTKQCEIAVSSLTRLYYISMGAVRDRRDFKTFKGAIKAAERRGLEVINKNTDPMVRFLADDKRTKIVTNLLSGKLARIPVNTPLCCDPSSETYWSM